MIFRAEAAMREKAIKDKLDAEAKSKQAVEERDQLEYTIKNLTNDKEKAKALALKAIAARSNIKQYLDDEKARNGQLQQ